MLFSILRRKKYHGTLLDLPQDGDERCRECGGVCCSSFSAVEISWEEYHRLTSLGALRLQRTFFGRHRLEIDCGCEFLVQGRCRIYDERPDVCRRFICRD